MSKRARATPKKEIVGSAQINLKKSKQTSNNKIFPRGTSPSVKPLQGPGIKLLNISHFFLKVWFTNYFKENCCSDYFKLNLKKSKLQEKLITLFLWFNCTLILLAIFLFLHVLWF